MKAHEVTVETAIKITGLDIHGVQSMMTRGVLHRVERGEIFIQRASLLDCYVKDQKAREMMENALGPSKFWEDLEEDLKNPDFVEAYVQTCIEMNASL